MNKEEIRDYLLSRDLRASDVVKRSGGLIGLNQASGWVRKLRRGEDLSNPVLVMLWKIGIERNGVYDVPDIEKDEVDKVVESLSPKFPKKEVKEVTIEKKVENLGVKSGIKYVDGIEVRLIKKDSERVSWWIGEDERLYKNNEGRFSMQEVDNYKGIKLSTLFNKYFG